MKPIRLMLILAALAAMVGCVAVPVAAGPYGGEAGYYAPAPAYYAAPVYVAPSISFGIRGGGWGHNRGRGHR